MKIAILSPFYPYRGGLAQFNARLYTELMKGDEVKAFSFTTLYPDFLFPGKTQYVSEGDSAVIIDNNRVLNTINPVSYIKTAKAINRYAPDILFIPYWMSFLAPAYGSVCRLLNKKIKVVVLVHNAIPHERNFFDKPFAKYFFSKCDAFVVMSDPVKKDLLSLRKDAKILLQPHPIYDHYGEPLGRTDACRKLGIKEDKKNLLFFGLIRDYKGLDELIKAMERLDNDYQLIIAGESYGSFEKYTELIEQSPFKDNIVVMEQYIPDDMVTLLFSAADVLVLPYRSATQSGVVSLAYQLELPMVGTDVGALGSTIKVSQTGIVVPSALAENISAGIIEFFSDQGRIEFFRENTRKEKSRLSWANFAQSIRIFFSEL